MKIKCRPDDFVVEELPAVETVPEGAFRLYRLEKTGMGTPEVVELIRRRWNLAASQVKYGGLKDRHARTVQYFTILHGPDRGLAESRFRVEPLGKVARPYGPGSFRGNRFSLVIRDLSNDEADSHEHSLAAIGREGWPNYFDDQRFGSVTRDGRFIGGAWLQGDHEQALRLALAEPTTMDRPGVKREKALLRECWGDWTQAKAKLPRSHTRSIVTYLADHPTDFKGAFARLNRDLRSIWFSAFQSHLWNLLLARTIESVSRPDQRTEYAFKVARLPIYHHLDPAQAGELASLELPLPSARNPLPDGPIGDAVTAVLAPYDLTWEDLRVRGLKDVYLSKGGRAAVIIPDSVMTSSRPDDLYPGRHALELQFELPRGAYATMLVKRLTEGRAMRLMRPSPSLVVLFEDNHCLAVDKPAGLLTQGDATGDECLLDQVRNDLRVRYQKPGNVFVGLLHRLDRPVSGVVLFAKTSKAASRLSAQFRDKTIQKVYLAVVEGEMEGQGGGLWRDWLRKDNARNQVSVVAEGVAGGLMAESEFRVLGVGAGRSLVELRPRTGRPHQLRVQLASRGFPIVGDLRYGARARLACLSGGHRIALHAQELRFTHPTRREEIVARSQRAPGDWPAGVAGGF